MRVKGMGKAMEHTSVVEGKLERLTPKKQESVLRMLDVIIEEMMK